MKRSKFGSLSLDELWTFREKVATALAAKMAAQKSVLEYRLRKLDGQTQVDLISKTRRSYPTVYPKYRNPQQPPKLGQEGANNLVGLLHNSSRGSDLMIFEFNQLPRNSLEPDLVTLASSSA